MILPYAGSLSAVSVDPVEKKPLYHFYPGSQIFSVGFFGCSLSCPFCQNWNISKTIPDSSVIPSTSPAELINQAVKSGSRGIAYTYSEPLVHFEYIKACAVLAHEKGLYNVLVSNGFLEREPAQEILSLMDGCNIDLKSFNPAYYRKTLKGELEPVKDFIRSASSMTHLEVTTLIVPEDNDDMEELEQLFSFLGGINPDIPLHLSAYYPSWKYTRQGTENETLLKAAALAKKSLNWVYIGNTSLPQDTICPDCSTTLIDRRGYKTKNIALDSNSKCRECGCKIPVIL